MSNNKKLLSILSCLALLSQTALGASKSENLQRVINLNTALGYAAKVIPELTIPYKNEIDLALGILGDVNKGVNLTKADVIDREVLKQLGIKTVEAGTKGVSYALMASNPWLSIMIGAAPTVVSTAPVVISTLSDIKYKTLTGNGPFNLDDFLDPKAQQTTYLYCSYVDPNNSSNNFGTWAYEKYLGDEFKKNLPFEKDTVLLKGRWVKDDNSYAFGTLISSPKAGITGVPELLTAACIQAIATYAEQNKKVVTDLSNVQKLAKSSSLGYDYPIYFFIPVLKKAPTWQKMKPVIMKEAVRLVPSK